MKQVGKICLLYLEKIFLLNDALVITSRTKLFISAQKGVFFNVVSVDVVYVCVPGVIFFSSYVIVFSFGMRKDTYLGDAEVMLTL